MLSWLWHAIKGPTARRPDTVEERAIPAEIADRILSVERKAHELKRAMNERELAYQRAVRNREGRP